MSGKVIDVGEWKSISSKVWKIVSKNYLNSTVEPNKRYNKSDSEINLRGIVWLARLLYK